MKPRGVRDETRMRGRKPKPTKLKIMAGEPNKDRINDQEPEAPVGRPVMPDGLDDVGRKAWDALCDSLDALGILSTVDHHALEIYCHAYSGYRAALDTIKKQGMFMVRKVTNGDVRVIRHPLMPEIHSSRAEIMKMQAEFGLTPSARSRLVVPGGARKTLDILDELLA